MVSIKGKVIDQTTEGADEHLKRLAKRYLGIGKYYYRKPSHKRIIIKIQPEKIMGLSIHPAISLHILRGIAYRGYEAQYRQLSVIVKSRSLFVRIFIQAPFCQYQPHPGCIARYIDKCWHHQYGSAQGSWPYASTKSALEGLSEVLQYEVDQFGIKVILVEPGIIKTNFPHNILKAKRALFMYPILARLSRF
jgi:hypothetical protein